MEPAQASTSPSGFRPGLEPPLGPSLILLACGRHDRGRLYPKARRQLQNLKEPLRKLVENYDGKKSLVFHDGSVQAETTVALMGFPFESIQGELAFLFAPGSNGPDECEMSLTYYLITKTDTERTLVLILDTRYVARFAAFYQARLGKTIEKIRVCAGDAVVFETDGKLHHLSPGD